jgi:hypothetical protein
VGHKAACASSFDTLVRLSRLGLVFTATVIDCGPLSGDPMQLARFESDSLFQAAKIIRTVNPVNVKSAADGIPLGHVRIIVITVLKVSKLCKPTRCFVR